MKGVNGLRLHILVLFKSTWRYAGCGSQRFTAEEEKKTPQHPVRTSRIFKRCWTDRSELIRLQVRSVQTFSERKNSWSVKKQNVCKPEHRRQMLSPEVRFAQSPHSLHNRKLVPARILLIRMRKPPTRRRRSPGCRQKSLSKGRPVFSTFC